MSSMVMGRLPRKQGWLALVSRQGLAQKAWASAMLPAASPPCITQSPLPLLTWDAQSISSGLCGREYPSQTSESSGPGLSPTQVSVTQPQHYTVTYQLCKLGY